MPIPQSEAAASTTAANGHMRAAVYRGSGRLNVESLPLPRIGPGEVLIRVETCGVCHTDLKKIAYDLLPPPRVYGHETAGVIAEVGAGVTRYSPGDRVIVFHHIPCGQCFYCRRKLYAQCPVYKKVGVTAGFEAAGGGFAQYVRVMDWIVKRGIEKIPDGVSFEQACFVEPVNTCLKAVKLVDPQPEDVTVILGQGPIGLIFTMIAARLGTKILATDTMGSRRALSLRFGAQEVFDPSGADDLFVSSAHPDGRPQNAMAHPTALEERVKAMTDGRGADVVIVAASAPGVVEQAVRCSRPGARIMLFAQTSHQERIEVSGAAICMEERLLCGSYSASVDLQAESAELVFSGALPVAELVSHRFPLSEIHVGIERALHPDEGSLKIVIQPQR